MTIKRAIERIREQRGSCPHCSDAEHMADAILQILREEDEPVSLDIDELVDGAMNIHSQAVVRPEKTTFRIIVRSILDTAGVKYV